MKAFLRTLLGIFLLASVAAAALALDLVPHSVLRWVDGFSGGETAQTIAGTARTITSAISTDGGEGESLSTPDDIMAAMRRAMYRHETNVSMQFTVPQGLGEDKGDYLLEQVEQAFNGIRREYPEIFWMGYGNYSIQWSGLDYLDTVSLIVSLNYSMDMSAVNRLQEEMDGVVEEILRQAPQDTYGALKYFHDWIVDNTTYDMEAKDTREMVGYEYAFNIDGVFLRGSAVCEGYAKAMKLLCDQRGISCKTVFGTSVASGGDHAWNYVRLDGSWYLVDCTADDPVGAEEVLRWDYFLKGTGSTVDGQLVQEVYQEDGSVYPAIAHTAYVLPEASQPQAREEVPQESIRRVELWLLQRLEQGETGTRSGDTVGTFSAEGDADSYAYQLTGDGPDDHRFVLDEEGTLLVGATDLGAGTYEIRLLVTGGTARINTVIRIEVYPEPQTGEPELPDAHQPDDSHREQGNQLWLEPDGIA